MMQKGGTQSGDRRSRGGRATEIHALTDVDCRPVAFVLTSGHVAGAPRARSCCNKCRLPGPGMLTGKSRIKERCRTCRQSLTRAGKIASRRFSVAIAMLSGRCSDAWQIFEGSPPGYDRLAAISSPQSALPRSALPKHEGVGLSRYAKQLDVLIAESSSCRRRWKAPFRSRRQKC